MPRTVKPPKDPNAPKKPQSSYFLFSNERRKILAKENPTKKITEISTLISNEWKSLTADDKEKYVIKAAELKNEYKQQLDEYKQTESYTNFQKKYNAWKEEQKLTKKLKNTSNQNSDDSDVDIKKKSKSLKKKNKRKPPKKPKQPENMPKRPQSSYFLFSNERRPQLKEHYPDKSVTELSKLISNEWKSKTDEEKKVYSDRAAELKKEYAPALAKYKESEEYKNYDALRKQYNKDKKKFDAMDIDSEDESEVKVSLPRKPKDKNAPKKPLSSYFLYAKEVRESVKSDNPSTKITEIAKIIAGKWKVLDENVKKEYNDQAKELKSKYDIEIAEYNQSDKKKEYDAEVEKWKQECESRKIKAKEKQRALKKKEAMAKNIERSNKMNMNKNKNRKRKRKKDDSSSSSDDDDESSSDESSSNSSNSNSDSDSDSDTGSDNNNDSSSDNDSDSDSDDDDDSDNNNNKKRKKKSTKHESSSDDDDDDDDDSESD